MIKVLLVDDEAMIRALIRTAITAALPGAAIFEADCGEGALRLAPSQAPFQLVVTDIMMPGMDGLELAAKLSAEGHARKFLFISAYSDPSRLQARMASFPSAVFISKPFNLVGLIETVRSMAQEVAAPLAQEPRMASVRHQHRRAEFRLRHTPAFPLARDLRRMSALRTEGAVRHAALQSALSFQRFWLERIQKNLVDLKTIAGSPPGFWFSYASDRPHRSPDSVTI